MYNTELTINYCHSVLIKLFVGSWTVVPYQTAVLANFNRGEIIKV